MSAQTLAFNYWQTVNNRGGYFKLGYSGVSSWKQFLFPRLKQWKTSSYKLLSAIVLLYQTDDGENESDTEVIRNLFHEVYFR